MGGHHRVFNRTKKAIQRWAHDRLAARHTGPMLSPSDLDARSIRRALIILPNWRMGNLLLATPLARWLREGLWARGAAEVEVDICSGGDFAALLQHHPHIRRHLAIPTAAHPIQRRALRAQLAEMRVDLALLANYARDPLGMTLALATGARLRAGAGRANEGPLNLVVSKPDKDAEITEQHRAVIEQLGLTPDPTVDIEMVSTPAELAAAREEIASWELRGRRPVGVFFVGHRIKQMPLDLWAHIVERIRADHPGLEPVAFHAPGDIGKARALAAHLTAPVRLVCRPLRQFAALVEGLEAVVSCDCGPLHLARAKRRPLVSLFTKANWDKFAPRGQRRACLFRPGGPRPEEVSNALRAVLAGEAPPFPAVKG